MNFVKIEPSIMNNINLGGKILNFNFKGNNVEPYNCGSRKKKGDFLRLK